MFKQSKLAILENHKKMMKNLEISQNRLKISPPPIPGVKIENFKFLVGQPIFTSVRAGPASQNGLFRNTAVSIHDHKIFKNCRKMKRFSFSERCTSKLSVCGFGK